MSVHSGAAEICITDHPSSPALASRAIHANIEESIKIAKKRNVDMLYSIQPYEWGSVPNAFANANSNHFTRIIAADCLWMPSQHRNLVRSITHFLSKESSAACALVVAGFHTGRTVVAEFFRQFSPSHQMDNAGERLVVAQIYESDMNDVRRGWQESRANEDREEAKRWSVVAVIVRHNECFSSLGQPEGTPPEK